MSEVICDFCSSAPVRWSYPATDFKAFIGVSVGGWAACERCHQLIQNGDLDGLMKRSLVTFMVAVPDADPEEIKALLSKFHYKFFENRTGPPVPYQEEPVTAGAV